MSATILVLDDDAVLRDLLCEVLQDEGFTVIAAESLPKLLAVAPKHADLLITDMLFDFHLGGLDAIKQVRAVTNAHLPALICSAAQKQIEALQPDINRLGARLLEKPFTIDELVTQVNRMIKQRASISAAPMLRPSIAV